MKIADRVASLGGFAIPERRLKFYGLAMHYAVGAGAGLTYGLIREVRGSPARATLRSILAGSELGIALFLAGDKALTPVLGVDQGSLMGTQAYGLSSHVVYGVVVAATWDQTRAFL